MEALAEGQFSHPDFPPAVDHELRPEWPLGVAAQWTVLRYFRDLLHERHKVISNEDPEGVHQIRVAARRVRTALQTFSSLWRQRDLARFLKIFGDFADVFTEARDTDVMLIYLAEQLKTARLPRRNALLWLQQKALQTRAEEQPRLVAVLEGLERRQQAKHVVDYFARHPFNLFEFDPASGEFLPPAPRQPATFAQPQSAPAAPASATVESEPGPSTAAPQGPAPETAHG